LNLKWKYLIKRTGQMILTMWIISTVLFFIFRLMPGNPLVAYINPTFTEKQQEILMEQFGLNKPLWMQYFIYLKNLLQGKLGQSFFFKEPVTNVIAKVLPNTIYLMLTSLIMAYVIGIIGGIFLAWKRGETIETYGLVFTLFTRSAPQFWVGMLLLAVFSFQLDIFPSGGVASAGIVYGSELEKLFSLQFYKHLFLPALTLTIYLLGLPLLLMRSNMLDVMDEAYVQMAKMRGVNKIRVMFKYAARNAFLPVITAMAVGIGYAIGGNVVIEKIFSWPGLGRLLVKAVSTSDYPLAQGAFILIAAIIIFMNFLADIFYNILDPRVNIEDRK